MNDSYPELLEIVAADPNTCGPGSDEAMKQLGRTLYAILTSLFVDCRGKPLNMARMLPTRNGWELWRQLVKEYEPRNETRGLGLLDEILNPDFKGDMSTFEAKLSAWETRIVFYESGMNKKVEEDLRRAVLLRSAPSAVAEHLKINISRFKTYRDMRQALDAYFVAKREYKADSFGHQPPAAGNHGYWSTPMEVDNVGKGQKSKGDGKKGKGGVKCTSYGKTGHDASNCWSKTDLKCTHCGKAGHLAATCWAKGKAKGKGKKRQRRQGPGRERGRQRCSFSIWRLGLALRPRRPEAKS